MKSRTWSSIAPWLALTVLLLVPLYAVSGAIIIRSGLFDLNDTTISDKETTALWAFIASGIATGGTIVGLLLTRSYNDRALERTTLDTVVKGLELLVNDDGSYSKKAKVAGSLAALVHLGHPTIAMRTLSVAWDEAAVDAATACWLLSEAFRGGSEQSHSEASELLSRHAADLTATKPGHYEWPPFLTNDWPQSLALDVRGTNLYSLFKLLLSRDRTWWGLQTNMAILLLNEARRNDADGYIRDVASAALQPLVRSYPEASVTWSWKGKSIHKEGIENELSSFQFTWILTQESQQYLRDLEAWAT